MRQRFISKMIIKELTSEMDFTSKFKVRTLDELIFAVRVMVFFFTSFEYLTTFVLTFKQFIWTDLIMAI